MTFPEMMNALFMGGFANGLSKLCARRRDWDEICTLRLGQRSQVLEKTGSARRWSGIYSPTAGDAVVDDWIVV